MPLHCLDRIGGGAAAGGKHPRHAVLGNRVAAPCRQKQPLRADLLVLPHAFAAEHQDAVIQHGIGIALAGRFADQRGGLDRILRHAQAFEIEHAKLIARGGVLLRGGFLKPLRRAPHVWRIAEGAERQQPHLELCLGKPGFGRLAHQRLALRIVKAAAGLIEIGTGKRHLLLRIRGLRISRRGCRKQQRQDGGNNSHDLPRRCDRAVTMRRAASASCHIASDGRMKSGFCGSNMSRS